MNFWDSVAAFLTNQQFALLGAMIVPFIFKWSPKFKAFSNELCRFLALASAFAINVFQPAQANAAIFGLNLGSVFNPILLFGVSAVDAALTEWIHDKFANPLWKALGLKKPV